MVTGDEPMLPQPASDNAPMISGRGPRILTYPLGAYLTGDFFALLKWLSPKQGQDFHREIIRHALILTRKALSYIDPPEYAETIMELAEECLTLGTEEAAERMLDAMREADCDPRVCYDFYPRESGTLNAMFQMLGRIVGVPWHSGSDLMHAAEVARWMRFYVTWPEMLRPEGSRWQEYDQQSEAVDRWELDAMWAILHGRQPPPFPEFITS